MGASPLTTSIMSSLAEQKIALAKRILETNDAALLRSVDELVSGRPYTFSAEELASFERIREAHLAGKGNSSTWPEVRKRVRKAAEARVVKAKK